MIKSDHLIIDKCNIWYDSYCQSYKTGDKQLEDAVQLKSDHTKRVCKEMEKLCDSIALTGHSRMLAFLAALFHDVARFEQFKQYRTFSDKRSVNHAELALTVIEEHGVFSMLVSTDAKNILCAIKYHNAMGIPQSLNDEQRLLCQLLRDADKLDIYRIALDYYINPDPRRRETVQVGIPDGEMVTPEVVACVLRQEIVPYEKIQTVTDFKVIQLGWVYDLNFPHSFRCMKERGYVRDLKRQLPSTPSIQALVAQVEDYLDSRVNSDWVD